MNYALIVSSLLAITAPPDTFRAQVRTTEPLTANEQQATFHLPDGFEIQLFASEPDIQKPMNLAFDARGRLWMSGSVEYPYAAQDHPGRDTIKVLEDTTGDGRADKITTFVDGLNIPMGLYPYKDGVIAYSIPNIYYFEDVDGDGKADRRHVLYGPLGDPRDTHGMQNAFRRGFDGWLYINHGFSNTSKIAGRDGSSITVNSGNTYRVRVDGSRVEQFTWGQVNPFGSVWTPDGDLITTDCHSKPLTLLMRDGYYSSFGKPHDGLGYAPELMQHHHGSTGLAGAAFSSRTHFPKEFQENLFLGNVVTSRVQRDTLEYAGSSPRAAEQPDFITTDDPWFRPVDLRMGPDGALYIADFYNRIIGHYEVPLEHPGRDRQRGRIWRVVYRGNEVTAAAIAPRLDLASMAELVKALGNANLTIRQLAMDQLSDRIGASSVATLQTTVHNDASAVRKAHAAWTLLRLAAISEHELSTLLGASDRYSRIHGFKILAESNVSSPAMVEHLTHGLNDQDPRVRRAAAESAGQRADLAVAKQLLEHLTTSESEDDDIFLRHALRISLRNHLRSKENLRNLTKTSLTPRQRDAMINIVLAISSTHAASVVLDHVTVHPSSLKPEYLAHITRHLPIERTNDLVNLIQAQSNIDPSLQANLFKAIQTAIQQRGAERPASLDDWGKQLAAMLLRDADNGLSTWRSLGDDHPWNLEPRTTANGKQQPFLSSLPGGETLQGVLRSSEFRLPAKLSFEICGHRGPPNEAPSDANFARLVRVEDDQILRQAYPPRSDVASLISWDLTDVEGQRAVLEIVDGLDLQAYAWLAIANIEPPLVSIPRVSPLKLAERQILAAEIAEQLTITPLKNELRQLLVQQNAWSVRAAAARALAKIDPSTAGAFLIPLLNDDTVATQIRESVCDVLLHDEPNHKLLADLFQQLPLRIQITVAQQMALSTADTSQLLSMIDAGIASRRLLQNPTIRERMSAIVDADTQDRIDSFVIDLPPASDQLRATIAEQLEAIEAGSGSLANGQAVFTKQCATCHQVNGQGTLVGPQLDGIGNRGLERIIEDVLAPHRNVDTAFQTSIMTLKDGRIVSGLVRRAEGQTTILVDQQGKEFSVAKTDIDEQRHSRSSLMPDNFATTLDLATRTDLFSYLDSLRKQTR